MLQVVWQTDNSDVGIGQITVLSLHGRRKLAWNCRRINDLSRITAETYWIMSQEQIMTKQTLPFLPVYGKHSPPHSFSVRLTLNLLDQIATKTLDSDHTLCVANTAASPLHTPANAPPLNAETLQTPLRSTGYPKQSVIDQTVLDFLWWLLSWSRNFLVWKRSFMGVVAETNHRTLYLISSVHFMSCHSVFFNHFLVSWVIILHVA